MSGGSIVSWDSWRIPWELIKANLRLALDVATPHYHMKPGIIALPLDATQDGQILLLSMLINTTPGSVALDVSSDRKILTCT